MGDDNGRSSASSCVKQNFISEDAVAMKPASCACGFRTTDGGLPQGLEDPRYAGAGAEHLEEIGMQLQTLAKRVGAIALQVQDEQSRRDAFSGCMRNLQQRWQDLNAETRSLKNENQSLQEELRRLRQPASLFIQGGPQRVEVPKGFFADTKHKRDGMAVVTDAPPPEPSWEADTSHLQVSVIDPHSLRRWVADDGVRFAEHGAHKSGGGHVQVYGSSTPGIEETKRRDSITSKRSSSLRTARSASGGSARGYRSNYVDDSVPPQAAFASKARQARHRKVNFSLENSLSDGSAVNDSQFDLWPVWLRGLGCRHQWPQHNEHPSRGVIQDLLKGDVFSSASGDAIGESCSAHTKSLRENSWRINRMCAPFIGSPTAYKIIFWDSLGGLLIMYDCVLIPMGQFPLPTGESFFVAMQWLSLIFWSFDVLRNLLVGFEDDLGMVEARASKIVKKYVKSWMIPDVAVLSVEWIFVLLGRQKVQNRSWHMGKIARLMRILRIVRLLRLFKFLRLMTVLMDRIQSQLKLVIMKAFTICSAMVLLMHYTACMWYGVGKSSKESFGLEFIGYKGFGTTWLDVQGLADETDVGKLYSTTLWWAIAQGAAGNCDIYPTNSIEKIYVASVSVCGMVVLAAFITICEVLAHELRESNQERHCNQLAVRKFLEARRINTSLSNRIVRYFRVHYDSLQPRLLEEDVHLMTHLPRPLKLLLHKELYLHTLIKHPALDMFFAHGHVSATTICHVAVSERLVLDGMTVFKAGETATAMVFMLEGACEFVPQYSRESQGIGDAGAGRQRLESGDQACEAILWRKWTHRGHLVVVERCAVASLDAAKFISVIQELGPLYPATKLLARYAVEAAQVFEGTLDVVDAATSLELQGLVEKAFHPEEDEENSQGAGDCVDRVPSRQLLPRMSTAMLAGTVASVTKALYAPSASAGAFKWRRDQDAQKDVEGAAYTTWDCNGGCDDDVATQRRASLDSKSPGRASSNLLLKASE